MYDCPRALTTWALHGSTGELSLFLRNTGDWRSNELPGLGPEYRVVAQAATGALLHALSSQGVSFFVSALEALNFQPVGLANPSAEHKNSLVW